MALSPEEILLRWFNYHLEQAGHPRRVHNFSSDIMVNTARLEKTQHNTHPHTHYTRVHALVYVHVQCTMYNVQCTCTYSVHLTCTMTCTILEHVPCSLMYMYLALGLHGQGCLIHLTCMQDSECYTVLLDQIAPAEAGVDLSPLSVSPLSAIVRCGLL